MLKYIANSGFKQRPYVNTIMVPNCHGRIEGSRDFFAVICPVFYRANSL